MKKLSFYRQNWGERIRTLEYRIQIPMPYPLATPQKSLKSVAHFQSCKDLVFIFNRAGVGFEPTIFRL